jgi:RNA polymerase sigma-70 factor (ECF subfamily)
MDFQSLVDEELFAYVVAGYNDALTVLFDRYHRLVYSVALRIVRDTGEAEEVVQTVFLDIYRAAAKYDRNRGVLKVWILQYAYHRALHRKRHLVANRFYRWEELEAAAETGAQSAFGANVHESVHLAEEMLQKLKPRQRQVVELTYFEGLTAEEVAVRLKESVYVVRHDLHRGLAKLRKAFSKAESKENPNV